MFPDGAQQSFSGPVKNNKKEKDDHEEICLSVLSGVLGSVLPYPGSYDAIAGGETMMEVWGIASGLGSTKDAARGALTWRHYDTNNFPRQDWLRVLTERTFNIPSSTGSFYAREKQRK